MAIMETANGDSDVLRIWSLLTEVSEQLSQNRNLSISLNSVAGGIKNQAMHSQTGFVLRRFNLDKSKEAYEAELERMNTSMSQENQTLQNDNRQLNTLIREYEQTLESVMSTFRTRAHEVQQHELARMRSYERAIVQRETEALAAALSASNVRSASLARVGRLLRAIMRKLNGEDVQVCEALALAEGSEIGHHFASSSSSTSMARGNVDEEKDGEDVNGREECNAEDEGEGLETKRYAKDECAELEAELVEDEDPEHRLAAAEWALERDSELARLERENEELRRLLNGVLNADSAATMPRPPPVSHPVTNGEKARETSPEGSEGSSRSSSPTLVDAPSSRTLRLLGGPPGTVGPFGTYKKHASG
ncbi:hypothetical protein BKA93DRAFT_565650 [Sparassis latifolia]|uniref:Uncharacterized protein n=1 Tax=Sparassis crispa TaxID=139825 RepID=A0A401GLZ2_9APHY|nr:hypothetical protein SCP_0502640 [Sparassis crispa]GBE83217.1 hypothetical protein SCP_0502640 [Sparassis crispa]